MCLCFAILVYAIKEADYSVSVIILEMEINLQNIVSLPIIFHATFLFRSKNDHAKEATSWTFNK